MYLVNVYMEVANFKLDQVFTYYSKEFIQVGVRVNIKFNHRSLIGFVAETIPTDLTIEAASEKFGYNLNMVNSVVDQEPIINQELFQLAKQIAYDTISPIISVLQAMLPAAIKPKTTNSKIIYEKYVTKLDFDDFKTSRQKQVYNEFDEDIKYSEFLSKYKTIGKKLIEYKAFKVFYKEKEYQLVFKEAYKQSKTFTPKQQIAYNLILNSKQMVSLLYGVTGSGKTEIYLQLAEFYLNINKQVLILVPEIALTPQMVQRVSERFQTNIAIYHSGLSSTEKYDQYKQVKDQKIKIVVGTRSAIFMPFSDLGLIIIDEEHDSSYKQDSIPCYNVKDVAKLRAEYHHSKILLASATPSLDSYARALKNVYNLVTIDQRINEKNLEINVVDMKNELKQGQSTILSYKLQEAIAERLVRKEQVIILLNRRGYTPILKCNSCNEAIKCPNCDVALNYHKDIKKLKCHVCDYETEVLTVCPTCKKHEGFSTYGFGIQKLEEELIKFYPDANIVRMDADTTKNKNGHQKILEAFGKHEIDILCGTQMIAKGLDYPLVTLVGIINADAGLQRTDYRSCEECFDLLNQASGRSGRADKQGEVILQVFNTDHYVVKTAIANNYLRFFKEEMLYRHNGNYPPYTYLIAIYFRDTDETKCDNSANKMKLLLQGSEYKILGPAKLLKIKSLYRNRIIIKGKDLAGMKKLVTRANIGYNKENGSRVMFDVNPLYLE